METQHDDFTSRVLDVVASIPAGSVMTYGDVAAAVGTRAARAVGLVMARYGSEVAWWRVIRSTGHPAAGLEARALDRFVEEGTPLRRDADGAWRVDLAAARHPLD
ncbi:MAG: hypothetical protein RI885_243 [Actinomycetota bacterium]